MKNTLKSFRFLFTALVIAGLAMTLSFTTRAEDQPLDKMAQLELQVQSLLKFKEEVQAYNPNIVPAIDDFKNADQVPQQLGGEGTNLPPSGNCVADYQSLPSSQLYHESDWDLQKLPFNSTPGVNFQDLNGDGLVDSFLKAYSAGYLTSCVYLNNGRGWDVAYKCHGKQDNNTQKWTFYGDCAKTE